MATRTLGHAIVVIDIDDDAANDSLLEESIEHLLATIEAIHRNEDLRAGSGQSTRLLLSACADYCVNHVADGEHYGDLLYAAAAAVTAAH